MRNNASGSRNLRGLVIFAIIGIVVVSAILVVLIIIRCDQIATGIYKYFLCREKNLPERYGKDTWVVITGASSGQGREFALQFSQRSFHLFLIGSKRTEIVIQEIRSLYPRTKIIFIQKDFGRSFEEGFFDDIKLQLLPLTKKHMVSVLINNVGHRSGWKPYHEMPERHTLIFLLISSSIIRDTISCGTMVQSIMSRILIPEFLKREKRSAIIFITAQTMHPNFAFGNALSNEIYLPYLSVYEGSNNFGFTHANSLFKEYEGRLDFLNITPGAVTTENTSPFLDKSLFSIDCKSFVKNIIRMLGNYDGTTCGYYGHALSMFLVNIAPWMKDRILKKTGERIANYYMSNKKSY